MYKLTIISGPNRGTSYPLQEGISMFGRTPENSIALPSKKVSKRHCSVEVSGAEVTLLDEGSSNGTFVNGVLSKRKRLRPGDRIGVGEYVFELSKTVSYGSSETSGLSSLPNVIPFPSAISGSVHSHSGEASQEESLVAPTDTKGKVLWALEQYLMPFFYGLNLKHEWRTIGAIALGVLVAVNLLISIFPLVQANRDTIVEESKKRAQFMARQIVEKNAGFIANQQESRTSIGSIAREPGVQTALLVDLNSRIIAPPEMLNQHFAQGAIANIAVKAAQQFQEGRERAILVSTGQSVIAIEPVRIFSSLQSRNIVSSMAIVSLDTTIATPGWGSVALFYSQSFILAFFVAVLFFFILYRLTLKRFEILNEELDKFLKGDLQDVTKEFKMEELNSLWEILKSTLQRVPKNLDGSNNSNEDFLGGFQQDPLEDFTGVFQLLGENARFGLMVYDSDKNLYFMNPLLEDLTGIHQAQAVGQNIGAVGRDQAFISMIEEMLEQAGSMGDAMEEYEFSGVPYELKAKVVGSPGRVKGYWIIAMRMD
jgi:PAS domain-containing protein